MRGATTLQFRARLNTRAAEFAARWVPESVLEVDDDERDADDDSENEEDEDEECEE